MSDAEPLPELKEKPAKTGMSFLGVAFTSAFITALMLGAAGYQFLRHAEKFLPPPPPPPSARSVDLTPLQTQLDAQGLTIKALQERLESLPTAGAPDIARIEALEKNLADLPEVRAQLEQLNLIQQNIGQQLELQREVERNRPDLRLFAALQSLRAAAMEGTEFQESLQRFLALSAAQPEIHETAARLEPYASAGRPSLEEMQRGFRAALKEYLTQQAGTDDSLAGKVTQSLTGLITVRRTDTEGASAIAAVNRAERAAEEGRIARAREELADLPKEAAPAFAAWREEARAYVEIPALLLKLDQQLAETLAAAKPAEPHAP